MRERRENPAFDLRNRGHEGRAAPISRRRGYRRARRRKLTLALKTTLNHTTPFIRSSSTDPQSDVARARSWAAICVQDFDAPCVLQFAWISALCCALHRSTSQVIHRSGSYNIFVPKSTFLFACQSRGRRAKKEYRANVLDCFLVVFRQARAQLEPKLSPRSARAHGKGRRSGRVMKRERAERDTSHHIFLSLLLLPTGRDDRSYDGNEAISPGLLAR